MGYSSTYTPPSERASQVLYDGNIISPDEQPYEMVERVVDVLSATELSFGSNDKFAETLGNLMDSGKIVMSTPIMTNSGRYPDKPLSACTMPTIDLRASRIEIAKEIDVLHQQGMGTGFNLSDLDNPVEMLRFLNDRAVAGSRSGKEDRPVGNMAILDVRHPKIKEFIDAKISAPDSDYKWKFNISVDADESFMQAAFAGNSYQLLDGSYANAGEVFERICEGATVCADPGLIFMDRMNHRNPVPALGAYKTTAPCAEVGLIEGESCQFGYINVGAFVTLDHNSSKVSVDYDGIYDTARLMTRALDNALEISIGNYASMRSVDVMSNKRKIGVGICGVADAISIAGMNYDSPEAREMMLNVLTLINFASKEESIQLAEERGSCGAMLDMISNRYLTQPTQIERLYGDLATDLVSQSDWHKIAEQIRLTRKLRNISTVALPPTGRSALVIDASTGVEAHFAASQANTRVKRALLTHARNRFGSHTADQLAQNNLALDNHDQEVVDLFANATSVSALGHLSMAACLQRATDEAISKTVNLPAGSSSNDVAHIYRQAHEAGMSGITVYVDGTFGNLQPRKMDK